MEKLGRNLCEKKLQICFKILVGQIRRINLLEKLCVKKGVKQWVENMGWIVGWTIWTRIGWKNRLANYVKNCSEKLGWKIGLTNCVTKW